MAAAITPDRWVGLLTDYGPMALFVFMVFVLWQIAARNKGLTGQQKKIQAVALSGVWVSIFILAVMIVIVYFRTKFPTEYQIRGYIHNLEDPATVTTRDNLFLRVKYGAYKDFDYEWRIISPQRVEGKVAFLLQNGPADHTPHKYEIPIRDDFYQGIVDITYDPPSGKMKLVHGSEEETLEPKVEEAAVPAQPIQKPFWSDTVYASEPQSKPPDPSLLIGALEANDPIIRENARAQLIAIGSKGVPNLEQVFLNASSSARLRLEAIRTLNGITSLQNKDLTAEGNCAIAKLASDPYKAIRDQVSQLAGKKVIRGGCPQKTGGRSSAGLVINVYDGTRHLLRQNPQLLVRAIDGNQTEVFSDVLKSPVVLLQGLPFYDNLADNYTVMVAAQGYLQTGIAPVHLSPGKPQVVDLMLLPVDAPFNFGSASWENIKKAHPQLFKLLASGATEAVAKTRYEELMMNKPTSLASLLNLTTAVGTIALPAGNALPYLKELVWDDMLTQGRFFAYADQALAQQLKHGAESFAPEPVPGLFHPGATSSYRETQVGEANVKLIFYENDKRVLDGVNCIKVEVNMDYRKDLSAHVLVESSLSVRGLADPKIIYLLRWMAGRRAGIAPFEPPYTIN